MSNLITLQQKPVIDFSKLEAEGVKVKEEIAKYNIDKLVVTEETLKDIKNTRAKFNNRFKEYESSRKAIKAGVNDPYVQFENVYKESIANPFKEADATFKQAIDSVENELRQKKTEELQAYFEERNSIIDFVNFEQIGLNITLSASKKSLTDKIDEFIAKVNSDLQLISLEEHQARILVRYKKNLDVSQSIISVKNQIAAEEKLKAEQEEQEKVQAEVKPVEVQMPIEEPKQVVEPIQEVKRAKVIFTISDTVDNIRMVRDFMNASGIKYENGAK